MKNFNFQSLIHKKKWLYLFVATLLILALFLPFFIFEKQSQKPISFQKDIQSSLKELNNTVNKGLFVDYIGEHATNLKNNENIFIDFNDSNPKENNTSQAQETTNLRQGPPLTQQNNASLEVLVPEQREALTALTKSDTNLSLVVEKTSSSSKAKLVIIIDDMAFKEHVRGLKKTGLKLTPSFFPADSNHPRTKEYAKEFDFFMVHLPLAAMNFSKEEEQTLKPSDTQELIDTRISQIASDFKGVRFINNHTGSLFTKDEEGMRKLFKALQKEGIFFVDSLTIGSSKGELMAKEFNQAFIKRDIFIDNEDNIASIQKQLQKAINIAKKRGFAIAIGHPKKNTFEALVQSKELLQSVDLVYLNELYVSP